MSFRDDILIRAIKALVEGLLRAAGLRKKQDLPAANQTLEEALKTVGLSVHLLRSLDEATLRSAFPDDTRRAVMAHALLELCAQRRADLGDDDDDALRLEARAQSLLQDIDESAVPAALR
jgi:hypothetical protein